MTQQATQQTTRDVAARLGMAVVRLNRQLRQQAQGELTPTMRATMGTIFRDGPLTLGELAAREQVAPPTVTKVVAKLEEAGLVTRTADAADRRVARVEVTPAGRRWIEADRKKRQEWLASRLERLDGDELRRVVEALDVLEALAAPQAPSSSAGRSARR